MGLNTSKHTVALAVCVQRPLPRPSDSREPDDELLWFPVAVRPPSLHHHGLQVLRHEAGAGGVCPLLQQLYLAGEPHHAGVGLAGRHGEIQPASSNLSSNPSPCTYL